jgi:hypothetical protein
VLGKALRRAVLAFVTQSVVIGSRRRSGHGRLDTIETHFARVLPKVSKMSRLQGGLVLMWEHFPRPRGVPDEPVAYQNDRAVDP